MSLFSEMMDEADEMMDRFERMRTVLARARDFIHPDRGLPDVSNPEMIAEIDAALSLSVGDR